MCTILMCGYGISLDDDTLGLGRRIQSNWKCLVETFRQWWSTKSIMDRHTSSHELSESEINLGMTVERGGLL